MPTESRAIPTIAPYPMPDEATLPANRVDWRPRAGRSILLVHDMQNYFLAPFSPTGQPTAQLLSNVGMLRTACTAIGIPVVYTAQPGAQDPDDRALLIDFWGPGLDADPRQAAIVDSLAPDPADTVLTKWRYSAFQRTKLAELMANLGRDQLIITGIYAHIGVQTTACDAFMRDIQTFLVSDAVADFGPDEHRQALRWVAGRCGMVLSARQLLGKLAALEAVRAG
jgi:bifunctional isochorismate lyase/aryl carrier protein